jgi:hypothetical protein
MEKDAKDLENVLKKMGASINGLDDDFFEGVDVDPDVFFNE